MASRYKCEYCGNPRSFVRYINKVTGEHLSPKVGRCERLIHCGVHYKPNRYFSDQGYQIPNKDFRTPYKTRQSSIVPVSYIEADSLKETLIGFGENCFIKYLLTHFGASLTNDVIARYFIGTSSVWKGSTIFWQIDVRGRIRAGKIMLYDQHSGKRIKIPRDHITWFHKTEFYKRDFKLKQCLFGEHLLLDEVKPVAIVESEKTAVIASLYLPHYTWLATGGLTNLSLEKCLPVAGRDVILFPDLDCYERWTEKVLQLGTCAKFHVSDILEKNATKEDREAGLDLADYLIRFSHSEFVSNQ